MEPEHSTKPVRYHSFLKSQPPTEARLIHLATEFPEDLAQIRGVLLDDPLRLLKTCWLGRGLLARTWVIGLGHSSRAGRNQPGPLR